MWLRRLWVVRVVGNVGFWVLYHVWITVAGLTCAPLLLVARRPLLARVAGFFARTVQGLLAATVGLRHREVGREQVPAGPVLYAMKHQSTWDAILILALIPHAAVVIREPLLRIPVFGWWLKRLGLIVIDPEAGPDALFHILEEGRAALDEGRPVVIYPEGERVPAGERGTYHPGVAMAARRLGAPLVPVAHNAGAFWPLGARLKRPGRITLEFLPPIDVELPRAELLARLEQAMEQATTRLLEQAR
jgi:1-acyl-sn-glycerol-3-phosphate acyltransferase